MNAAKKKKKKRNLNSYYKYIEDFKVKHEDNEDINGNYKIKKLPELKIQISEIEKFAVWTYQHNQYHKRKDQ